MEGSYILAKKLYSGSEIILDLVLPNTGFHVNLMLSIYSRFMESCGHGKEALIRKSRKLVRMLT